MPWRGSGRRRTPDGPGHQRKGAESFTLGVGRTYFTLQEYSPRSVPRPGSNLQASIARRIAELGSEDYNTRQQASRVLESLGHEAKEPLLLAYRTATDAEVRQRLKVILAKMFPACLQIR